MGPPTPTPTRSFFDLEINQIAASEMIFYSFPSKFDITSNGSGKTSTSLSVPYVTPPNAPTITINNDTKKIATATTISFYHLLHNNILNVTCDSNNVPINPNIIGEMIIENKYNTDNIKNIYLCFLLSSNPDPLISLTNSSNDVDDIINAISNGSLDTPIHKTPSLSTVIPTQYSGIRYKDASNMVYVFNNPIYINSSSSNIVANLDVTTPLFKNFSATYNSLNTDNIKTPGTNDIYIDCSPTGESAETIATYSIPINSEYVRQSANINMMETTVQLCIVFIFLGFSWFTVPIAYKSLIIDTINNTFDVRGDEGAKLKFKRLNACDFYLAVFCFYVFVIIITNGFSSKIDFLSALYFIIFIVISYIHLHINKSAVDFYKTKDHSRFVEEGDRKPLDENIGQPKFQQLFGDILPLAIAWGKYHTKGNGIYIGILEVICTLILQLSIWLDPSRMTKNIRLMISLPLQLFISFGFPTIELFITGTVNHGDAEDALDAASDMADSIRNDLLNPILDASAKGSSKKAAGGP